MSGNSAKIDVEGEISRRVASSTLNSLGVKPNEVSDIELRLVTGNGNETTVHIEADGQRSGSIVSQMLTGVDMDEHVPKSISVEINTGEIDTSGGETDDEDDEVELTGEDVEEILEEVGRYVIAHAREWGEEGDGEGELHGITAQKLFDWSELEFSVDQIDKAFRLLEDQEHLRLISDDPPEYRVTDSGKELAGISDEADYPDDRKDPDHSDDFGTVEQIVDDPYMPQRDTKTFSVLEFVAENEWAKSRDIDFVDNPSTLLSNLFRKYGVVERRKAPTDDNNWGMEYRITDWAEERL